MTKERTILDVSKDVRERYYRIKFRKHGEEIGRRYSRVILPLKEYRKTRVLDNSLATYKREADRAAKTENDCIKTLINMGLYYLIAEKDIQCIKIDALTHPDRWRRKLLLRVILLTIYEWDMGKAGTGNLKEMLNKSNVEPELQNELFSALRELRKAQKEAAKLLHFERNNIIAHRNADALMQLSTIESLEAKKVFKAAELFYSSSKHFMAIFPKVLIQAGTVQGLFSYMLRNSNT
jgi:hypothetical protein